MACPRNSPGENTKVDCHSPLQGSNPGLLHCRPILYHLSYQGIYSFDYKNLCQQSEVSAFNTLSRFVIAFLPRSKCLLISWLWSPSTVILEPKKIKLVTASTFSPFCLPWGNGTRCHDLSFWNCWVSSQLFHSFLSPSLRGSLLPLHFLLWYRKIILCCHFIVYGLHSEIVSSTCLLSLLTCSSSSPPLFLDCWWPYLLHGNCALGCLSDLPSTPFWQELHRSQCWLWLCIICECGTSQRHSEPQRQIPTGLTYSCELGLHTFSFSSKCAVEKQCKLMVRVQAQEPKRVNLGDHFYVFTYKLRREMPAS